MAASVKLPACSPDLITELTHATERTEVIYNACELKVFTHLQKLGRPSTTEELAKAMQVPLADILDPLLKACVSLGLLDMKQGGNTPDVYSNSPVSAAYLTEDSPFHLLTMVSAARHQFPIAEAVKAGRRDTSRNWFFKGDQNAKAFDDLAPNFRRYYLKQDGYTRTSLHLLEAFNLDEFNSAVDLGGGMGTLCEVLAGLHPHMQVTNVDFPKVLEFAEKIRKEKNQEANPAIKHLAADLDTDPLPSADLYILGHLLHMHPDDKAIEILKKVNDSIIPGGALLLLEKCLSESRVAPELATMYHIRMDLGSGGKERTLAEYRKLLESAGFTDIEFSDNKGYNSYDAILARRLY